LKRVSIAPRFQVLCRLIIHQSSIILDFTILNSDCPHRTPPLTISKHRFPSSESSGLLPGIEPLRRRKDKSISSNIMPSQARSDKTAPNILNLLCGHYDLVLNLADVMSGMKQYASLSSLSAINQEYHAVLQPYLKSKKRRIVVELSDVRKLSKSRYKDIE
jgi:hypothetical protein